MHSLIVDSIHPPRLILGGSQNPNLIKKKLYRF